MTTPQSPQHGFIKEVGSILNAGQSRSILLTGEVHDLFFSPTAAEGRGNYVPLIDFVLTQWANVRGKILIVYEQNGPIRFVHAEDRKKLEQAWSRWRVGLGGDDLAIKRMLMTARERQAQDEQGRTLDSHLRGAARNSNLALELLRQLCVCSRSQINGEANLAEDLIILIEGADMLLPEAPIHQLSDADRHRISVCQDWLSDPDFGQGDDSVIWVAESSSLLNHRVGRLPHLLEVPVGAADEAIRSHAIAFFVREEERAGRTLSLWSTQAELARLTAGLNLHALFQLLRGAAYREETLRPRDVIDKVEAHIKTQLGDDVVEFKKPSHSLDDVVGYGKLKAFLKRELIPRLRAPGGEALPGAAVCGPIGTGKTFIFEAVAAELDLVVLVLKNIRSKWFGETDVVFERLRRAVMALDKVVVFVDEADTQFGGVGQGTHATERRLTGKIQAMMSDPALRGRVIWLLMTARIHLLSPDIRRPGRVGDLIIPVLDPEPGDCPAFCRWMVDGAVVDEAPTEADLALLLEATDGFSAAGYASLRSELRAKAATGGLMTGAEVLEIVADHIPPSSGEIREFQTLHALLACTRRSLLPDPNVTDHERQQWRARLRALEERGIT